MYFGFSPELNAVIDAGVAKYGQLELAKRFLFHYMRENGVTYGDAWQCLMELPESCFKDSAYFYKVEQFYAKYAEIVDEDSADTVEEYIRCSAKNDVLRSILGSSNDPVSRLLYNACHAAKGLCWDYERIQNSFAELDNETGIPDFHPPAITFSTPIASLDDARKAVAARVVIMTKRLFQRVADEAKPPAILGRPGCGPPDYFVEVLLHDLVESGAWLDLELKRPFLALWVNEESFDDPDVDDPIEILTNADAHKFAAMDPVVDLESLRGMRVCNIEPYIR